MKKVLIFLTAFFFGGMLFLTVFAEPIHNASLPRVTVERPQKKLFPYEYTDENGNIQSGSAQRLTISKDIASGDIYVIYTREKNGTKRYFVKLVQVQTGEEKEDAAEVISGIEFSDKIVKSSTGELFDGCEVMVE